MLSSPESILRLIRRSLCISGLLIIAAVVPLRADSPFRLELEGGPAWQTRNDFAVPGDVGSRVSLADAPAVAALRGTLIWDFGERWSLRVLAAPFSTETEFVADSPVRFEDAVFPAGVPLTQRFEFNSYRFSFLYRFRSEGPWSFRAGVTGKVRDASLSLAGNGQSQSRDDLGFVPLLYGGARYDAGGRWAFDAELDGLGAPQGRAIDLSLRAELRASDRVRPYLGVRWLDGGADNDEVLTFATVHYALAGVSLHF